MFEEKTVFETHEHGNLEAIDYLKSIGEWKNFKNKYGNLPISIVEYANRIKSNQIILTE